MGSTITLILLAATFVALVAFIIRGGNTLIGLFVLAIIWGILGGLDFNGVRDNVIQDMSTYGSSIIIIAFGAWFGRVMMATGIIDQIIKKTVELGGSFKLVTWILLTIVTHIIFMGSFGIGLVITIGLITIPVMVTLGIPKKAAVASLLMAVASGNYVTVTVYGMTTSLFPDVDYSAFFKVGLLAGGIQLVTTIIYEIINTRNKKIQFAWAVAAPEASQTEKPADKKIFFLAYLTPIVPVVLSALINWQAAPAFIVAILWALVFSGNFLPLKKCQDLLLKTLQDGLSDIGLLTGLLLAITAFGRAASACAPLIGSFLQPIIPTTPLIIAIAVGILAPLSLFRGPLNMMGVGAALGAILVQMGTFSNILCLFLIVVPTISMGISACPTQSWNVWALSYAKLEPNDLLRSSVLWQWMACLIIMIAVSLFIGG
ncbi:MAG: citrate transporter [Oscillospiraceae bacterium]|nr:citrate transporter [Oscillospiraceae bacterium]